jgi:hypothetical protein
MAARRRHSAANGTSPPAERLIAVGEGPAVVELSPRRRGILESDLISWLHQRRRTAPVHCEPGA